MPNASGANPVASALGNRTRRDPGTAVRTYHEGLNLTPRTGTFYFGGNRNFLLWSDRSGAKVFCIRHLLSKEGLPGLSRDHQGSAVNAGPFTLNSRIDVREQ